MGFTALRILSTSFQESQVNWSNTGLKDGQGASSSGTVSKLASWSWQSNKTLSAKWLAKALQLIAKLLTFLFPSGREVNDLITLNNCARQELTYGMEAP